MGKTGPYLDGCLLVAMPTMGDPRFRRSVVYVCAHSREGAMGIIVNQVASGIDFRQLLAQLDIMRAGDEIRLPPGCMDRKVFIGGPVETGRGFVLHSPDYFIESSTLPIASDVCLTSTIDILRAMVSGRGPRRSLFALGYSGWAPGQLEAEIRDNGWLMCDASAELVFDTPDEAKYDLAMRSLGIDPAMLSSTAGEA